MKYTSVELLPKFKHRYKFEASLYNIRQKELRDVVIFLDLGCFNTMIPKYLAEQSGRPLDFRREYRIGGHVVPVQAFSIDNIVVGNIVLERVLAFAGDYPGEYESDILLGTNVMNNWEMIVHKKTNRFEFREDPPDDLPNKTYIYQNYFDMTGNYVYIQDQNASL